MPKGWQGLIVAHRATLLQSQQQWSATEAETFWADLVSDSEIYQGLCDYARRMLSDWDSAEEAVQETIVSLSTRLTYEPTKSGPGGVRGWVFRSLHNRICSILRKRYKDIEARNSLESDERERMRLEQRAPTASRITLPEFMLDFDKLIQQLDMRTREVVHRTFIDGQTDGEISRALRITEQNVRVIRYRGVQRMCNFVQAATR